MTQAELEHNPDFWWLRLRYAMKEGHQQDADEARRQLKRLGIDVKVESKREGQRQ